MNRLFILTVRKKFDIPKDKEILIKDEKGFKVGDDVFHLVNHEQNFTCEVIEEKESKKRKSDEVIVNSESKQQCLSINSIIEVQEVKIIDNKEQIPSFSGNNDSDDTTKMKYSETVNPVWIIFLDNFYYHSLITFIKK